MYEASVHAMSWIRVWVRVKSADARMSIPHEQHLYHRRTRPEAADVHESLSMRVKTPWRGSQMILGSIHQQHSHNGDDLRDTRLRLLLVDY